MGCPSDDTLAALLGGLVLGAERRELEEHVDECVDCRCLVAQLAEGRGSDEPVRWGRYVELEAIGRGATGQVYRAHDPQLDRQVAIKTVLAAADPAAQARLSREARALAQLSDPNIVPIYDVGLVEDGVYIAMQLVHGQTLREWLDAESRAVPEVLDAFIQAGRGLATAHEAGLVHRDFKPTNVMVSDDGGVQVLDFGMAAGLGATQPASGDAGSDSTLDVELTRTGTVLGTPAYMAPEQHRGEIATPRCDQFAFCTALYEGLFGARPFSGTSLRQLAKDKERGPAIPDARRAVPKHVVRAVLRGLTPRPEDRFESMRALLAALELRRRSLGVVALSAAAVAVLAVLALAPSQAATCSADLSRFWNDGVKAQVASALVESKAADAAATAERVGDRLDAYARSWSELYSEACSAAAPTRDGADRAVDARLLCLEDRARHFKAIVEVVTAADDATAPRVATTVWGLPSVESCRTAIEDGAAVPTAIAEAVEHARSELARVRALRDSGQWAAAVDVAREVRQLVASLEFRPLQAETAFELALAMTMDAPGDEAAQIFQQAYFAALAGGEDLLAARAAVRMVHYGRQAGGEAGAQEWIAHAEAAARRHPDIELSAALFEARAASAQRSGLLDQAVIEGTHALMVAMLATGPESLLTAQLLVTLADIHFTRGELDQAIAALEHTLRVQTRALGSQHPEIGYLMGNLGLLLGEAGRPAQSLEVTRAGIAILTGALGPEHPEVGRYTDVVTAALTDLGRHDEALAAIDGGIAVMSGGFGAASDVMLGLRYNRATVLFELSRLDEAEQELSHVIVGRESILGPDDTTLAGPVGALGRVRLAQGRIEEAVTSHRRALALSIHGGEDSNFVAMARVNLAESVAAAGQIDEARTLLELALRRYERDRDGEDAAQEEIRAMLDALPQ